MCVCVTPEDQFVCLESVKFPGMRAGILPDGNAKDPDKTGTGPHGRFIPIVIGTCFNVFQRYLQISVQSGYILS